MQTNILMNSLVCKILLIIRSLVLKKVFLVLSVFFLTVSLFAQEDQLVKANQLEPEEKSFYEKESIFSVSKNGALSFDSIDDELFVPLKSESGAVLVRKSGNTVVRGFYDEKHRLVKKQYWNIKTLSDSSITRTEIYTYKNDLLKKLEVVLPDTKTLVSYNGEGVVVSETQWALSGGKEIKTKATEYFWKDGFLFKKTETSWTFSKENYSGKSKKLEKKWIYERNGGDIPDNYTYYEDDEVKVIKKYTDLEDFELTSCFDNDLYVVAVYEKGVKVSETMYSGSKILRKSL